MPSTMPSAIPIARSPTLGKRPRILSVAQLTPSSRRQFARKADSAAATTASASSALIASSISRRASSACAWSASSWTRKYSAARAAFDSVEPGEALALDARDLRLAALDRVHPREPAEIAVGGGPFETHSAVSGVGSAPISPPAASTKPSQSPTWDSSSAAWTAISSRCGRARPRRSPDRDGRAPRSRGGTGRSSARAPQARAPRRTTARRRGARARCDGRDSPRCAPRPIDSLDLFPWSLSGTPGSIPSGVCVPRGLT